MAATPITRFHISLNVSKLERSVAFFRTLFGTEPVKLRSDYAKFELDDPALVLAREPNRTPVAGGALNHAGIRVKNLETLHAMYERANKAGISSECETGVECCYARQSKFWAHDPDGTLWEVYTFDGDIEHRGDGQVKEVVLGPSLAAKSEPVVFEHRMGSPIPDVLPYECGTVDAIRSRGTFNLPLTTDAKSRLVKEAVRVLKPGGRVFIHVLTGDRPVENPTLPGPAGVVKVVPTEAEPVSLLRDAGFTGVRMLKYDAKPCFVRDGVAMRETQVEGWKPVVVANGSVDVLYKGPFRELVDDAGTTYPRGRRVSVPSAAADQLRAGSLADSFVLFDPIPSKPVSCGV